MPLLLTWVVETRTSPEPSSLEASSPLLSASACWAAEAADHDQDQAVGGDSARWHRSELPLPLEAQRPARHRGEMPIDDASQYVNSRPSYGIGVHAILPTLADPVTCLSLRVPGLLHERVEDHLFENGTQLQMERIEVGEVACRR